MEYFKMINPIEHSKTKEAARKYKVEPYVVAADIYGRENLAGRGGWTWYTGASSWLYEAALRYILGFRVREGKWLTIEPHIPPDWKKYTIYYQHRLTRYHIEVEQKHRAEPEVWVNGEKQEKKEILLQEDGKVYHVTWVI